MLKFYKSMLKVTFKVKWSKNSTGGKSLSQGTHMPNMNALSLRIKSNGESYQIFEK